MRTLVAGTDPAAWRSPELRQSFVAALEYEANLLRTLAAYRTMVLRHAQWLDTGSSAAYDAWRDAEVGYRQARDEHVARYAGNVDLPAYNFTAADLGSVRADRDPAMAWVARGLLVLIGLVLLWGRRGLGSRARRRCGPCSWRPPGPGGWATCRRRRGGPTGSWCGCCPPSSWSPAGPR
ncbi:hypothetical protein ACFQX7_40625 [Luedemannella flava]